MSKDKLEAGPLNPHVPNHLGDEHWGNGGRFILDPATGKRVPAPEEASDTPTPLAADPKPATTKKGS